MDACICGYQHGFAWPCSGHEFVVSCFAGHTKFGCAICANERSIVAHCSWRQQWGREIFLCVERKLSASDSHGASDGFGPGDIGFASAADLCALDERVSRTTGG